MRNVLMGAVLAAFAGSALAAGDDLANAPDTSYAAKVYYRMDFGGAAKSGAQSVGLRFDSALSESRGAPAFMSAKFSGQQPTVYLAGAPVAGYRLSSQQGRNGQGGWFSTLSVGEWVVLGLTALTFGVVVADSSNNNDAPPAPRRTGTGG